MDVIRTYVRGAFAGVAQTPEALEQQQELITNMEEKVRDLVADGKGEQEALGITIAEAGDLTVLAAEFPPAESGPLAPPTASIRGAERLMLARVGAVFAALIALLLMTALVGSAEGLRGSAFLLVCAATVAGVWRLWSALREYRANPATVETVVIGDMKPLFNAVLKWVGICVAAVVFNAVTESSGFWAWIVWAAGAILPAEAAIALLLVKYGIVTVEPAEPKPLPAETPACAPGAASAAA
jgi:hypothetical protein